MPTKPETLLKKIDLLPSHQVQLCLKFKDWLVEENDNTERNWINYLKKIYNLFLKIKFKLFFGRDENWGSTYKQLT